MSKMSQLHMELSESAAELGFESIDEAKAHGYKEDYRTGKMVPDIDQAYEDLARENEQALKEYKAKIKKCNELLNEIEEIGTNFIKLGVHK